MREALWWLGLNILTIIILAYYSMIEMAAVSFNKVRLHYYVEKKIRPAIWLNKLLKSPSTLFGTTLIGVNVAMVAGSECARQFHQAIGLNPDLAPLTQVIIVVIFGELAPMFAARHYAEHVSMLGVPLLYFSSIVLTPFLWIITFISEWTTRIIGKKVEADVYLSQEELQKLIEETDEDRGQAEFDTVTSNIFRLREKTALSLMIPIRDVPKFPSTSTVGHMRNMLEKVEADFFCIFHHTIHEIVGIAFARDLLRISDEKRIREHAKTPWFVPQDTPLTKILHQFRSNHQTVSIVLDKGGSAIGVLYLDDILDEIFTPSSPETPKRRKKGKKWVIIDRTFSGDMTIREFRKEYGVRLDPDGDLTLAGLISRELGHAPEEGQSIFIEPFELIVKEASLLEAKKIAVKTRIS